MRSRQSVGLANPGIVTGILAISLTLGFPMHIGNLCPIVIGRLLSLFVSKLSDRLYVLSAVICEFTCISVVIEN